MVSFFPLFDVLKGMSLENYTDNVETRPMAIDESEQKKGKL
jgi:hypothetical protein